MITDAQYVFPEDESESEESGSAGVEVPEDILVDSEFDVVSGNAAIADEAENGNIYRSLFVIAAKTPGVDESPYLRRSLVGRLRPVEA